MLFSQILQHLFSLQDTTNPLSQPITENSYYHMRCKDSVLRLAFQYIGDSRVKVCGGLNMVSMSHLINYYFLNEKKFSMTLDFGKHPKIRFNKFKAPLSADSSSHSQPQVEDKRLTCFGPCDYKNFSRHYAAAANVRDFVNYPLYFGLRIGLKLTKSAGDPLEKNKTIPSSSKTLQCTALNIENPYSIESFNQISNDITADDTNTHRRKRRKMNTFVQLKGEGISVTMRDVVEGKGKGNVDDQLSGNMEKAPFVLKPSISQQGLTSNFLPFYSPYQYAIVDPSSDDILFPHSFGNYFQETFREHKSEDKTYVFFKNSSELKQIIFQSETGVQWSIADQFISEGSQTKEVRFVMNKKYEWILGKRLLQSFPVTYGVSKNVILPDKTCYESYIDIEIPSSLI